MRAEAPPRQRSSVLDLQILGDGSVNQAVELSATQTW